MRIWVRRVGNALFPDGDEANMELEKLPMDKPLQADLKQPRNPKFARLYWVLCTRIGQGIGKDRHWVSDAFKVEIGFCQVFNYGGKSHLVLKSTTDLDEVAFKEYFEECVQIAYNRWNVPPESIADLLVPEESQRER